MDSDLFAMLWGRAGQGRAGLSDVSVFHQNQDQDQDQDHRTEHGMFIPSLHDRADAIGNCSSAVVSIAVTVHMR